MSLPRALRRLVVLVLATLTALAASVTVAAVASAHVTVSSADAAPGGFGKLTFRVPNESDTASTVSIRIQIPEEAALASLRAQPVPGWTVTLTTSDLEEPIESHGQEISSYVSVVEFRADGRRRHPAGRVPGVRPLRRAVPRRRPGRPTRRCRPTATAASRPGSSRPSMARSPSTRRRPSP